MRLCRNLFGDIIKNKRVILNLSQEDLVAKLNLLGLEINQSDLSRIESFKRPIYDYELYCLCKVLNINIAQFMSDNMADLLSEITMK
ncbi:XRE family transcriptional regulator [Clostridium sartagoforme]|uniref:XRE family transcriptional regulator n=1 Tax=Clostridium sartagoforme TaxID=84031 RepID=A0A4S2DKM9_9CLOT|nr:helix-turn-helix transcriptional regulator [Clostridium sartagoforme]TGY42816.1 XRE family transcriptional regulator [Clostridium sartagoforme]